MCCQQYLDKIDCMSDIYSSQARRELGKTGPVKALPSMTLSSKVKSLQKLLRSNEKI